MIETTGDAFGELLLPSLQRETLTSRVAVLLKRHILAENLQAGARLPSERRLADALSVSRTVLREALSQLVGEGLIKRVAPQMLCVASFDREQLAADLAPIATNGGVQALIELRVILELGAIEAIVKRATDDDLRSIERWVVDGEKRLAAGQPMALADARFHDALLQTLKNPVIDSFLPLIEENLRQNLIADAHQFIKSGTPDDYRVVDEHRRIFAAIMRRDVQQARLLMLAHLNSYLEGL